MPVFAHAGLSLPTTSSVGTASVENASKVGRYASSLGSPVGSVGGGDPLCPDWGGAKLGERVGIEAGFGQEGAEKLLTLTRGEQRSS